MTRRSGTVLIIVMVLVMLLSLVAYKYLLAMQTEHMVTAFQGQRVQAKHSADSAHDLLKVLLRLPRDQREAWGGLRDNPALFAGNLGALKGTQNQFARQRGTVEDEPHLGIVAYTTLVTPGTSDGSVSGGFDSTLVRSEAKQVTASDSTSFKTHYGAKNESAKLHLWKLIEWEQAQPGAGKAALMVLPGMDEATADALLDWLDEDDEPRDQGGESEFYATLSRPIAPRNGMPFEMEELLFVRGVTMRNLYGTQTKLPWASMNSLAGSLGGADGSLAGSTAWSSNGAGSLSAMGTFDGASASSDLTDPTGLSPTASTTPAMAWDDLLTIYSAERNESYTGEPRIFLNTPNLKDLHQAVSERISTSWADFIVLYRQFGGQSSNDQTTERLNNPAERSIKIDFEQPAKIRIESLVDLLRGIIAVPASDESSPPTLLPSPASESQIDNDIEETLDQLTLSPQRRLIGRINIEEAPLAVLKTLTSLTPEQLQEIQRVRESMTRQSTHHVHPIWLLTEGIVDDDAMRVLLPDLTCGGDVYRAEIWGRSQPDKAMYRMETILDASGDSCRTVYFRELDVTDPKIKVLSAEEFAALGTDFSPPTEAAGSTSTFE